MALANETDPERFMWAVLPHAARSFSASIVVLPRAESRVAAVAYLYARMLDTYEDLLPNQEERPHALRSFAARLRTEPHPTPIPISDELAVDHRDRLHILLVQKIELIDAVYATLPAVRRQAIADLVESMAEGMAWSSERFVEQGGVLIDDKQLLHYCHNVIGYPARFVISLLTGNGSETAEDAFATSEMIQLANITRDIEKDMVRGIAYDPALSPHLYGSSPTAVKSVRERLVGLALPRAPAYQRLYLDAGLARRRGVRLAAVLMLLFTDLHYRSMVEKIDRRPWRGPRGKVTTVLVALPSLMSNRYASWMITRVTERLTSAATRFEARTGRSGWLAESRLTTTVTSSMPSSN